MTINKVEDVMAKYRSEFYHVYHNEIKPIMLRYEDERRQKLVTLILLEVFLIVMLVMSYYMLQNDNINNIFWFVAALVIAIASFAGIFAVPISYNSNFIKMLKENCMPSVLKIFGDIQWKLGANMITNAQLDDSELFMTFNRRASDDVFWGKYKEVGFSACETNLYYESGSGRNRTYYPVFNGVIINFASNKKIKNKTIIATKGDYTLRRSKIFIIVTILILLSQFIINTTDWFFYAVAGTISLVSCFFIWKFSYANREVLNEIKLEDPEFSKKYKAYSSDEVEGRYLITPAFMERFVNIKTAFGAKKVKCSFYGKSLMFAITSNKNLFEIGNIFHRLDNPKQLTEFFNELASILVLVDYFKLDENTKI